MVVSYLPASVIVSVSVPVNKLLLPAMAFVMSVRSGLVGPMTSDRLKQNSWIELRGEKYNIELRLIPLGQNQRAVAALFRARQGTDGSELTLI